MLLAIVLGHWFPVYPSWLGPVGSYHAVHRRASERDGCVRPSCTVDVLPLDEMPQMQCIPINHHFLSAVILAVLALVVALGGTLSQGWADGGALIGGGDVYTNVQLGLWFGTQASHGATQLKTFYYGWCEQFTGSYSPASCFDLQAARVGCCGGIFLVMATIIVASLLSTYVIKMRLEPTMGRVAAVFSGGAAASFLMTVCVWARLVLTLSDDKAGTSKASLNLEVSWLAIMGAFVLTVFATMSLVFAAKKVDAEIAEQAHDASIAFAASQSQVAKTRVSRGAGRHQRPPSVDGKAETAHKKAQPEIIEKAISY